jgi:dihydroceramide fatty acyl 2-hydroxylase
MPAGGWKQFTPFYFYASVASCLAVAAAAGSSLGPARVMLLLALGFLSWGAVEYLLHRVFFHALGPPERPPRFAAAHRLHHDRPRDTEQLFTSLRMSAPIALCYFLLAWAGLRDWAAAAYLLTGLIAGYLCYEWVHYLAHHGRPRVWPLGYLKRYHLLHHNRTPDLRFGVTSPLLDHVFGTFRPVTRYRARQRKSTARAATGRPSLEAVVGRGMQSAEGRSPSDHRPTT